MQTNTPDPFVEAFPETRPFWDAAARGILLLPRCGACGETHWHPRAHCPFCGATDIAWEPASGAGTLHSYSTVHRREGTHVLAYVQLDEGPVLMTNVIDCPPQDLRIGLPVQAVFGATAHGRHAPMFRPHPPQEMT